MIVYNNIVYYIIVEVFVSSHRAARNMSFQEILVNMLYYISYYIILCHVMLYCVILCYIMIYYISYYIILAII